MMLNIWQDLNVMVAFFSRISPAQNLHIQLGMFMLRLQQEAVTAAMLSAVLLSATKGILQREVFPHVSLFVVLLLANK
ncbi:MAG: hypothetical protein KME07_02285 [Pegethrix bostrychoides GSE-TBD4-15B]|jgi:hypothetical protein|uniref:Uncharacterized protein n=1 Tax=Pegethrix bostrychoides GSE-TBD4-15B TaxID=2839662 RepID=A0A951P7Q3_9CYAN|nr:hypothetical protein [Pegethrix bostrychoides GSE-TBD4-15B]